MRKRQSTLYFCDVCNKSFRNPSDCLIHESTCLRKKLDSDKLNALLLACVHHFESLGYIVSFRYLDDELITELRIKK